jgi:rhodanese-related sulfurtransferase/DNA-binding transcriptional ArsR family regulator
MNTHMQAAFYEQFARIGKAISSPGRLQLLDALTQGERTVEALAAGCGMGVANASQHLRLLAGARLVASEKHGLHVRYRIAGPAVETLLVCLQRTAAEQLAEVARLAGQHLHAEVPLSAVDHQELSRRVAAGEVTLIDVRPVEEYVAGHLPGALSVPLPDLARHLDSLPREREVVAYCRGPYCAMSGDAVAELAKQGYRASVLSAGVLEWRNAGLFTVGGVEPGMARPCPRPRPRPSRKTE